MLGNIKKYELMVPGGLIVLGLLLWRGGVFKTPRGNGAGGNADKLSEPAPARRNSRPFAHPTPCTLRSGWPPGPAVRYVWRDTDPGQPVRSGSCVPGVSLMHKKVAAVLSGCGVYDGAEIHESVITLLRLSQRGAEALMLRAEHRPAPCGQPPDRRGNAGKPQCPGRVRVSPAAKSDLSEARAEDYDALIVPGGFGAAKNLSDFAINGAQMPGAAGRAGAGQGFRRSRQASRVDLHRRRWRRRSTALASNAPSATTPTPPTR